MARVDPVSPAQAGWSVRLTYWFTRRAITRLTGQRTEAMIEPVQVYARIPALLRGYAKLEQATAGLSALPDRVKALAELRAATLTTCEYCIDLGSQIARRWGLADAQLIWSGRLSSGQGEAPPGWMSGGASFGWPGLLWVGASRVYATALSG